MSGDYTSTALHVKLNPTPTAKKIDPWNDPRWGDPIPFTLCDTDQDPEPDDSKPWEIDTPIGLGPQATMLPMPHGGTIGEPAARSSKFGRVNYEPTLEEIAAACAAFRVDWTEEERLRRERGEVYDSGKNGRKAVA